MVSSRLVCREEGGIGAVLPRPTPSTNLTLRPPPSKLGGVFSLITKLFKLDGNPCAFFLAERDMEEWLVYQLQAQQSDHGSPAPAPIRRALQLTAPRTRHASPMFHPLCAGAVSDRRLVCSDQRAAVLCPVRLEV